MAWPATRPGPIRLPIPSLVILVGPGAAGKSTWANEQFRPDQVVSSDRLRAMVGEGEHDQRASGDAFALLAEIVERRVRRGLTTVIDTLGLDRERRAEWLALARRHQMACHVVGFDTAAVECRARNKARERSIPAKVLNEQIEQWAAQRDQLAGEGYDGVHQPSPVQLLSPELAVADPAVTLDPTQLSFGLHLTSYEWAGDESEIGPKLARIGKEAEEAGFTSLWLMDHLVQIPQQGREWERMLESWTTLGYLAAATERLRIGVLVSGITYRNIAHLAKIAATVDVLSGGRLVCGLGAAWFGREHTLYGYDFPSVGERYARLEDALQLLPLMWGPGAPPFEGRTISVPRAVCYPRPLQTRVPILVGGSGERRTLRLVAQYADACNLFGDAPTVAHKVAVLHEHCRRVERDPAEVSVTQLSTVLVGRHRGHVDELVEAHRPRQMSPDAYAAHVNAGTLADHVARFRDFAAAGLDTAIVALADLDDTTPIERFAEIIDVFR